MSQAAGARRLARFLALLAGVGAVLSPVAAGAGWLWFIWLSRLPSFASLGIGGGVSGGDWLTDPDAVSGAAAAAATVVVVLAAIPTAIALWSVRRTFLESADGRPFSISSVGGFRRFAWASVAAVVAGWVEGLLLPPVVTGLSPGLEGTLVIGLSSTGAVEFVQALFLLAIAHVFVEGRRMSEDVEGLL